MALTRPQMPEKPPMAARPRFKPPLLPPKPSASLFILSPPSTAKTASTNNNVYKPQRCLSRASDASSSHPGHTLEVKGSSPPEELSPKLENTPVKSHKPPPLPSLPPPVQRKGPAHSGSFTLPASFRNKHNQAKLPTSPTINSLTSASVSSSNSQAKLPTSPTINSLTSASVSSSASSNSNKSLQRNTSPLHTVARKPQHNTLHRFHTFSEKHSKSDLSHLTTHLVVKDTTQNIQEKCISPKPESQKSKNSNIPPLVLPKPSAASLKPASLLSEVSPSEASLDALSKSSTPAKRTVIASRSPERSNKHAVEVAEVTDTKSVTGKKAVPPPIPKNPPRAGVFRKSRSVNTRLSQAAEATPGLEAGQQDPQCLLLSSGNTGDSRGKTVDGGLTHSPRVDTQQSTRDKVQKLLQRHQHTLTSGSDKSNTPVPAVGTNTKPSTTSITGSPSRVYKSKTLPKPRLRSGSALQSSLEPGIVSSKFKDVNSSRLDHKADQISGPQNIKLSGSFEGEPELAYIEVYRGDTHAEVHTHSAGRTLTQGPDKRRQLQNTAEVSVKSDKAPKELVSRTFSHNSEDETCEDFPSLLRDQPEDTCDMLKEIEELLKNKLGHLEFSIEQKDTTEATSISGEDLCRQNSEPSRVTSGVISVVESVSKPSKVGSSSFSSPRLGHHADECSNFRNLQSVARTTDKSTVDFSFDQSLGKGAGLTPGSDRKVSPPKPKRTFIHRANNLPDPSSAHQHFKEEGIGPTEHSDVLEKNQVVDSSPPPPPLPPRNKPISLRETGGTDSSVPNRGLPMDTDSGVKVRSQTRDTDIPLSSPVELQTAQPGTQLISPTRKPSKSRPSRESLPPPPPGPPKRAATFSPGDIRLASQRISDLSEKPHIQDTTASKASYMLKKCYSLSHRQPGTDLTDVQASGSASIHRDALSQGTETKRRSRFHITEPQVDSSLSTFQPTTKPSSDGQMKVEKTPRSALLRRVAQGLGLRKSTKKSQIYNVSIITSHPHTVSTKDDYVEDKIKTRPGTGSLPAAFRDGTDDSAGNPSVSIGIDPDLRPAGTSLEATGSDSSVSECPLSEASRQSTSSEGFKTEDLEDAVSSGTDTEPEPDKEEIYMHRKAKKVLFIAKEIVSSESKFVDVLRLLNMDFRVHISRSGERCHHPLVPAETVNKILDFLPQLQNLNEDLLKDLSERVEHWDRNPRLADIFVKKGPFLKLYTSYIRNFENATAVLEDACKRNSAFAAAVKEFEMSPRCVKLALKHYMLKPIQRIPQYKLLLQDYLKHLAADSPDYKDTINALSIVSEVVDHANNSMRHGDHLQKLLQVQRSLVGQFEVIQPGRVLIKQGELQKLSRREMQPRMFFLFNDVLLYTTPTSTGYKINNILSLTGMKINSPNLEHYKFEFNIISVQRSFTLCASSFEEKAQWVSAMETAIEENAKKHHTFVTVRQGIQMSLQDKDFILGDKAPVWVPDARVTMCMLCLLEFTLTLRRHHCRSCGRVVCCHCSQNKAPLRYLAYEPARVCDSCFEKLKDAMISELERSRSNRHVSLQSDKGSPTWLCEGLATDVPATIARGDRDFAVLKHDSGLSLHGIMDRFQKLRTSNHQRCKPNSLIPSVLKEVHANDEGCDMCGYLHTYRSRKWKRLWFVVKGKVLYTYKASEDMAAVESMPLLGFEVSRLHSWFEGHQSDLLFELSHQNNQPLTTQRGGSTLLTHVMSARDKVTQRLVFRTDSAASTERWVTVLREASFT